MKYVEQIKAGLIALILLVLWCMPDKEWWEEIWYSCRVYAWMCVCFVLPLALLYLLVHQLIVHIA
jgi:hypothetical protein